MVVKKQIKSIYLDISLAILTVLGLIGFWLTQSNILLKITITILLLFSFWRLLKKDNASILLVVGFIDTSVLFQLSTSKVIVNNSLATGLIFAVILFLFAYRHARQNHQHFIARLFSVYNSLLALLISELFFILTFFQIDSKNKAILVVLWLWLYDELIESVEEGKLTKEFARLITILFATLFIAISLTFNFVLGF